MADWNDIKKAFERDAQRAEEAMILNEQKLLKTIATYICSQKGLSAIQGYQPDDIVEFLQKPIAEIKSALGGAWADMEDEKLETLIYTLVKKVKKSDKLIPW